MGDDRGGLGEVLDSLAGQLGDPGDDQQDRGGAAGRRGGAGRGPKFQEVGRSPTEGRPVACTLPAAARWLGTPLGRVREAAAGLEPYTHHDGSPRWSLAELERALGRKHTRGSAWRGRSGTVARPRPPDPSV
jgi:hypothetical protein